MPAEEEAVMDAPVDEVVDDGVDDAADAGEETYDDADGVEPEDADEEDSEQSEEDAPEEGAKEETVAQDGRKMPDFLKKAMSAAKAAGVPPEQVKQIKSNYFENQEYRSVFPSPPEAVAAKSLIETIGGKEGIAQIESERQEWAEIDRGFAEAKPEFVKGLAENNPEAFLKIAPMTVNEWAARAPEQYGYFANRVAVNTLLQQPGVEQGLGVLRELHGQLAQAPWAQEAIANVINGVVGLRDKAAAYEQKRVDPERMKLEQDKKTWAETQRSTFESAVADKAESYLSEKMPAALEMVINGRSVDPEAMKGYKDMVNREVQRRMAEIPGFADKLESHYRTGDAKSSEEFIRGHYDRILPEAAKVIAPFLRSIPAKTERPGVRPPAQGTRERAASSEPGSITLKEMPSWDQLDATWRARPESTAELMQGRAVLKSGKKASGWA